MNTYELIAPCHFGLESVLKREIYDLGYDISSVEDGKVTFVGDSEAICRANINLRTTERILIKVGQFKAETFTELFDNTKALARWTPPTMRRRCRKRWQHNRQRNIRPS